MAIDVKKLIQSGSEKPDWISSPELIALFQTRVNHEEFNSRAYLAMANWANVNGWLGVEKYMRLQSLEEAGHAKEFSEFLLDLNIQPVVDALVKPPKQAFLSLMEVFQEAMKLELQTTKEINEIASLALKVNDHVAYEIASKFSREQRQEIAQVRTILDLLEIAGDDTCALLEVDKRIGER